VRSEHTFRDLCQEQSSLLTGSTCNWGKAHKMPCISRCGWPIRCFRVAWKVIDLSNVEPVVHCASNFQPKWTEAPVYLLWMSEKAFGPRKSMKMGLKFELPILMIRNEMVGERGFEPPTPWSRTRFQPLLKSGGICCSEVIVIETFAGRSLNAVVLC